MANQNSFVRDERHIIYQTKVVEDRFHLIMCFQKISLKIFLFSKMLQVLPEFFFFFSQKFGIFFPLKKQEICDKIFPLYFLGSRVCQISLEWKIKHQFPLYFPMLVGQVFLVLLITAGSSSLNISEYENRRFCDFKKKRE